MGYSMYSSLNVSVSLRFCDIKKKSKKSGGKVKARKKVGPRVTIWVPFRKPGAGGATPRPWLLSLARCLRQAGTQASEPWADGFPNGFPWLHHVSVMWQVVSLSICRREILPALWGSCTRQHAYWSRSPSRHIPGTRQMVLLLFLDNSRFKKPLRLKSISGFSFQLKVSRFTGKMRLERSNGGLPCTCTWAQKHSFADLSY